MWKSDWMDIHQIYYNIQYGIAGNRTENGGLR